MAKKKKAKHGGARPGAGRKPTVDKRQKLSLALDGASVDYIDAYAKRHKIGNRSEALRAIIALARKAKE